MEHGDVHPQEPENGRCCGVSPISGRARARFPSAGARRASSRYYRGSPEPVTPQKRRESRRLQQRNEFDSAADCSPGKRRLFPDATGADVCGRACHAGSVMIQEFGEVAGPERIERAVWRRKQASARSIPGLPCSAPGTHTRSVRERPSGKTGGKSSQTLADEFERLPPLPGGFLPVEALVLASLFFFCAVSELWYSTLTSLSGVGFCSGVVQAPAAVDFLRRAKCPTGWESTDTASGAQVLQHV